MLKKFGAFVAINDISLRVYDGEILGVIGPNGAGKSTLFSCLTGDLELSGGTILFRGHNVTHLPSEKRAKLGIGRSFQIPLIFPDMTVLENVMVGALLHTKGISTARERAIEVAELVGLTDVLAVRAAQLGTPGRKRLEIARALATRPSVLMLDEVMAGLTPLEVQAAIAVVRNVHVGGTTIIIVEHIMEAIVSLAQRVVVMNHGVQITAGSPQQVMHDPKVVSAYLGKRAVGQISVTQ
ncbi:MAG: ABC transporter ATP-binding protein [Rhodanobacteraceae bacterium]